MKVYISGAFGHRAEIRGFAQRLENKAHEVTSHWLTEPDMRLDDPAIMEWEERQRCNEDVLDVRRSDVLLLVGYWDSTAGGYHTEMGMAVALEMPIIVLGEPRNFFYRWPYVRLATGIDDALNILGDL